MKAKPAKLSKSDKSHRALLSLVRAVHGLTREVSILRGYVLEMRERQENVLQDALHDLETVWNSQFNIDLRPIGGPNGPARIDEHGRLWPVSPKAMTDSIDIEERP